MLTARMQNVILRINLANYGTPHWGRFQSIPTPNASAGTREAADPAHRHCARPAAHLSWAVHALRKLALVDAESVRKPVDHDLLPERRVVMLAVVGTRFFL